MDTNKIISVWFVTGELPPYFSGAGRNDLLLAPYCRKNGLNVTLVTNHHKGDKKKEIIDGTPVRRIKIGNDHSTFWRLIGPLNFLMCLYKKPRPSIVRFRGFSFRIALMIFLVKLFLPKIKVIVQPAMFGGDDAMTLKKRCIGPFLLSQILRSDAIFSMNVLIKESFISIGYNPTQIYNVNNPVDLNKFKPISDDEKVELRKKLNLSKDGFIYITSGIISNRKRQAFITKAFLNILPSSEFENSYLFHMGPTASSLQKIGRVDTENQVKEEENEIIKLIESTGNSLKVILLGNKKRPESFLRASDVFIHAAIFEGKSNALNEAFACALPSIVPDIKIYREQAPNNCTKFFEKASIQSLTRILRDLKKDNKAFRKMSKEANKFALNNLDPEKIALNYAEKFRNL